MKKINLDKILDEYPTYNDGEGIDKSFAKEAMIEFGKQLLERAAKNAEAIEGWNTGFSGSAASVDKNSILNTINEVG